MKEIFLRKLKNIWDLELLKLKSSTFGLVFLTDTSKQKPWLEIAAFYKRKLSRDRHAAQWH